MSLTTKKILVSIVSFALALCVSFAVISFFNNGSTPAYATESIAPDKDIVECEANYYNANWVDNGDGTITVTKYNEAANLLDFKQYNPYTNIIKKDLIAQTGTLQHYENDKPGICVSARWDAATKASSSPAPRVHIFDDGILIGSSYVKYSSGGVKTSYNSGMTLIEEVPFTIYFSVTNNKEGDTVVSHDIYFKMVRISDGAVYIEVNKTAPAAYSGVDKSEISWLTINGDSTQYWNRGDSSNKKVKEYAVYEPETYRFADLKNDEDISYFFNETSITKTVDKSAKGYQSADVYAPDFNNRMTFKFKNGDGSYGARIGFGERYSDIYFKLSFSTNYIQVGFQNSAIGGGSIKNNYSYNRTSAQVTYQFDNAKEYKVSIAIRDLLDAEDNVVFRMPILEVAEIGNESNCASVSLLGDFIIKYSNALQSVYDRNLGEYVEKEFQANLIRFTTVGDETSSSACGYTISSYEQWKGIRLEKEEYNEQTQEMETVLIKKVNISENAVLPKTYSEGKIFVGYTDSEGKLYAAGVETDLTAYTEDVFNAVFIDETAVQVLNVTDIKLGQVQLRFKLEIATTLVEQFEDMGAYIEFVVTNKSTEQIVQGEQDGKMGDKKCVAWIVIDVAESDYATIFEANANIIVECENGDAVINVPGSCTSSAAHCANYVKNNPTEFGREAWNEAYKAEFDRIILAGGAQ